MKPRIDRNKHVYEGPNGSPRPKRDYSPDTKLATSIGERIGEPDPSVLICDHADRVHPLGGGLFVCFGCWLSLLFGTKKPAPAGAEKP